MCGDHGPTVAADEAVADVVVTVALVAQIDLAVVGVQHREAVEADRVVELLHRDVERLDGSHVVARSEGMAGVEADLEAVRPDPRDQPPEFLELRPDRATLTGRVLERQHHIIRGALEDLGERLDDLGLDRVEASPLV